ncbi:TPA: hypothetical protein DCS34_01590 [Candidatus Peribacteria bacterium]|nr:MAG: hypothetical protein A2529_05130 [Candidatus Peribacteria bacterium RIFOXYD2_FULL_58_15]HAS33986.1 hypothetical protein [Candidatus Peribacteria bacterium]
MTETDQAAATLLEQATEEAQTPTEQPEDTGTQDDVVTDETADTGTQVRDIVEMTRTAMPESARQELEILITQLSEDRQKAKGKGKLWRPKRNLRPVIARAAALIHEYAQMSAELNHRLGLSPTKVRKHSKGCEFLDAEEEQAIKQLKGLIQIEPRGEGMKRRDVGSDQKRLFVALVRLLRKGNRMEELEELRTRCDCPHIATAKWEAEHIATTTRDLVPDVFPKKEEAKPEEQKEVGEEVVPAAPAPAEQAAPAAATGDHPVALATDLLPVTPHVPSEGEEAQRLAIIRSVAEQNAALGELLRGIDPRDPRATACAALIVQNRAILGAVGVSLPDMTPTIPIQRNPLKSPEAPGVLYRTPAGAELVIAGTQRGVVLILEGSQEDSGAVPAAASIHDDETRATTGVAQE